MALVVENGTGLSGADAYISVAEYRSLCDGWGYDVTDQSDTDAERKIRQATDFIDTIRRYKGVRLLTTQALEFPRSGLTDWSGHTVEGVPRAVKRACAELAYKARSDALHEDLDRGGKVVSESVGPISVTYDASAPGGKTFTLAEKLLGQFFKGDGSDMTAPALVEASPIFAVGMHDHEGEE